MANRKATFAKRQRETDLKDRAKQKEDRRSQKRGEVRENKGPQIAWDEAVHAVSSSDELPSLGTANQAREPADGNEDAAPEPGVVGPPAAGDAAGAASAEAKPAPRTPEVKAPAAPARHGTGAPAKPSIAPAQASQTSGSSPAPSPAAPRRVG
jgi:hypothetical protein